MKMKEHEWGFAVTVKQTDACLIRILKIKAGGRLLLSVQPETLYLQSGTVLCSPENKVISEGCGDISYHVASSEVDFIAISDATIYETRYMK